MGKKPPPKAKTGVRAKPISSLVLRAKGSNGVLWRRERTGAQTNLDFFLADRAPFAPEKEWKWGQCSLVPGAQTRHRAEGL